MPFRFSQLVLIWFFVASCSSDLQVSADYDKTVDFDSYKSFFFLPWDAENSKLVNEIDQYLLTTAVKGQMIDRGYAYGENAGDMAISLFIVLRYCRETLRESIVQIAPKAPYLALKNLVT